MTKKQNKNNGVGKSKGGATNKAKKVVKTAVKKSAKVVKKVAKATPKTLKGPKMPASSLEVLSHFQCGKCAGWWSIGDAVLEDRAEWFCPWCGIKNVFDK